MLQQDLSNLISGNKFINKFIQESQQNAKYINQILEWIPYNKFKNIEYLDKGGFSTVVLKNPNESSNVNEEFLNEVQYELILILV